MFYRKKQSFPHKNINVRACEDAESGTLFYFNNPDSGEYHIGAIGVAQPMTGTDNAFLERIKTVLSVNFPAGTLVNVTQHSNLDNEDIISTYQIGKVGISPIYEELAKSHADYFRSGRDQPLVRSSGNLLNNRQVYFGIKIPVKGFHIDVLEKREKTELIDQAFDGFAAARMPFRRLNEAEYRQLIRNVFNPFEPQADSVQEHSDAVPLNQQIFPIATTIRYGYPDAQTITFNDGEYYARVLSVDKYPRFASPYIMNEVVGEPRGGAGQMIGPFMVSLNMVYLDQQKAKQRVAVRKQQIDSQFSESIVKFMPGLLDRKQGVDVLSNELNRNGGVAVDTNLSIVLYGRTKRELDRITTSLTTYYPTLGGFGRKFQILPDKRVLRPVFEQAVPLNATAHGYKGLFRLQAMGVRHAIVFAPLYGDYKFRPSKYGSLVVTRRGEPAMLDIFDSDTNYNGIIFAESGAGKSVAVQALALDQLASGARIWVIDDGRSLEKLAHVVNAQYIHLRPKSPICLNPFTTIPLGGLQEEMGLLKTLLSKMAAPNDRLSDKELPLLEIAIQQTFETYGNSATVADVADFLSSQPDEASRILGRQLYPFARGQYEQWFNGTANIDFTSDFIVLEMGELKALPHLKDVIALQLFANINRGMKAMQDDRRKVLIVEEAKQWLNDATMAEGIEEVYARARKDHGAAICVTQSVMDIANSPRGQSILANTAWKLILKQKEESIAQAVDKKVLALSPYAQKELAGVHTYPGHYAEFMFMHDKTYGFYRLVLSPFMRVMLSTRGAERTEIAKRMEAGMSAVDAIRSFMRDQQVSEQPPSLGASVDREEEQLV